MPHGQGPRLQRSVREAPVTGSARMPDWQLRLVYAATAALVLSGLAWLLLHYFLRREGDFGPMPNPLEHPMLAVHGAAAMLGLFVLGSLLPVHLLRGWQQRRNLVSGLILLAVQALLISSGYALYYASGDGFRAATSLVHWWLGLGLSGLLIWHIATGRRGRRR